MRQPLLRNDPGIGAVDMRTLVGIASAIEREAVARYDQLARAMRRRGEPATAAAFVAMRDEESGHVAAVEQWAAVMGQAVPAQRFQWRLPEEIAGAWGEAAGSALLTPYRAFAVAVDNERRAFAYYAYLAAHADDARVQAAAEQLAAEELRHAALLRRWRRQAYHRERRAAHPPPQAIETVQALRDLVARHEAAIAACHETLAGQLRQAGDEESARLLEGLNRLEGLNGAPHGPAAGLPEQARLMEGAACPAPAATAATGAATAARASAFAAPSPTAPASTAATSTAATSTAAAATAAAATVPVATAAAAGHHPASALPDPAHLLVAAQRPLEALSEALEAVLRSAQGHLVAEAEDAIAGVVARLARVVLQTEQRLRAPSR